MLPEFDENFKRHIIRGIWTVIVMAICYFLNSIVRRIGSKKAQWLLRRVFVILLIFFCCLVTGFILDDYLEFEIGYIGVAVNISFWSGLLFLVAFFDYRLKDQPKELHTTGGDTVENPNYIDTNRVANLLEDLMDALKIQHRKGSRLKTDLERMLPRK